MAAAGTMMCTDHIVIKSFNDSWKEYQRCHKSSEEPHEATMIGGGESENDRAFLIFMHRLINGELDPKRIAMLKQGYRAFLYALDDPTADIWPLEREDKEQDGIVAR